MKRIYLVHNKLMNNCSLEEGKDYKTRRILHVFQCHETIEKLKNIDVKRNTELYLKEVPKDIEKSIKQMFEGTKISVKDLEKDI